MSTYLIVNLLALSMPLVLSFDKKVHFYSRWKYLFPAIILTMLVFIPWDVLFTLWGVWGFNPLHLGGASILYLPLEEWMFFIAVPYASLFTFEVFNAYIEKDLLGKYAKQISLVLIVSLLLIAFLNLEKAYTSVSFILASIFIYLNQFVWKVRFMGRFYFTYLVVLFPFLVVNGVLTGSFVDEEVVWYNNSENLAIRIFTIPLEDTVYGLLLILMNTSIYEFLKKKY